MLMDIIMESLATMDEETLNAVLESMDEEEMDLVNGYLDELDTEEDDADMTEEDIDDVVEAFMGLNEEELDQAIESISNEEFEYLEAACEKTKGFEKKVYDTRNNPKKFTITPEILKDAGIAEDRADEYFDAMCDFMAEKKYITWGRKELPEKIADHFKEERRITAQDITEFGWRYFKKAKAILLKNKGNDSNIRDLLDTANHKAIKSANWEILGDMALKIFAWYLLGGIIAGMVAVPASAIAAAPIAADLTGMAGDVAQAAAQEKLTKDIVNITNGVHIGTFAGATFKTAKDYSENKRQLNRIAARA